MLNKYNNIKFSFLDMYNLFLKYLDSNVHSIFLIIKHFFIFV